MESKITVRIIFAGNLVCIIEELSMFRCEFLFRIFPDLHSQVHSASSGQLRGYLEEKVAAPV
jgi:hypothetical protein